MSQVYNYAFVDSQNLNMAIRSHGWKLDYRKFRKYLEDQHSVTKAYMFIGFVDSNSDLYKGLQEAGFILMFKPTLENQAGDIKGNTDAEMVLQAMADIENYDQAVLVTGDGDFYCLVEYLGKRNKLAHLLVPSQRNYSALLKNATAEISFVSDLRRLVEYKPHTRRSDSSKPSVSRVTRSNINDSSQTKKQDGWAPITNKSDVKVIGSSDKTPRPRRQPKSGNAPKPQSNNDLVSTKTRPKLVTNKQNPSKQKPAGYRRSVA